MINKIINHIHITKKKFVALLTAIVFIVIAGIIGSSIFANADARITQDMYGKGNFDETTLSSSKTTFVISTYQDWITLQEVSKTMDLSGKTFEVIANNSYATCSASYNLANVIGFTTGIGTEDHPFKGTIVCTVNGVSISLGNTPLFNYIDASANLESLDLKVADTKSGLANTLIMETGADDTTTSLSDIRITGSIRNEDGCAGGLYGKVINKSDHTLIISAQKKDKTSIITPSAENKRGVEFVNQGISGQITVTGKYSGGLVGKVSDDTDAIGKVKVLVDSDVITLTNPIVTGIDNTGSNGGLVGAMNGKAISPDSLELNHLGDEFNAVVTGKGNNGLLMGSATNVTVERTEEGMLSIKNGSVTGTDNGCAGAIAGRADAIIFSNITGLELSGISLTTANTGDTGAVFGSAINCDYTLNTTITNVSVTSEKGNGGAIFGNVTDCKYTVADTLIENVNITSQDGAVGGVLGSFTTDNEQQFTGITIKNISLSSSSFMGGVIGVLDGSPSSDASIVSFAGTTISGLTVNHTDGCAGGLVGTINRDNVFIGTDHSAVSISFQNSDNEETIHAATLGGVIGKLSASCNIVNTDVTVSSNQPKSVTNMGGVIGVMSEGTTTAIKAVISDVTLDGDITSDTISGAFGGIAAITNQNDIVELKNVIDLSGLTATVKNSYMGRIIGQRKNALIYVDPIGYKDGAYTYGIQVGTNFMADEVADSGLVYRNGNWDSTTPAEDLSDQDSWLIHDDKLTGMVSNSSGVYQLSKPVDFLRLSVIFQTDGTWGLNTVTASNVTELLASDYTLKGTVNLSKTGIITLTKTNDENQKFSGDFKGNTSDATITWGPDDINIYTQSNVSLFPYTQNATFDTFHMIRKVNYATAYPVNGASLTSNAVNGIHINGVTSEYSMTGTQDVTGNYGGFAASVTATLGNTIEIKDSTAKTTLIAGDAVQYSGGLIGYVGLPKEKPDHPIEIMLVNNNISGKISLDVTYTGGLIGHINNGSSYNSNGDDTVIPYANVTVTDDTMNQFELGKEDSENESGGFLGYSWENCDTVINNFTVENNSVLTSAKKIGGLWNTAFGRTTINGLHYNSVTFTKLQSGSGLIASAASDAYLSVKDYTIDSNGVTVPALSTISGSVDEFVGFNIASGKWKGIVSIEDSDAKKFNNYYENQILGNKTNSNTRYYYNINEVLSNADIENGVLDSPEDVMAWHLFYYLNQSNSAMRYLLPQCFNHGTATQSTVDAIKSYQLGTDIDLSDYSYYPTPVDAKITSFNGKGHTITFDGDTARTVAEHSTKQKMNPALKGNQHSHLQTGLFDSVSGLTVSNLNLQGTVSAFVDGSIGTSGALVTDTVSGKSTFNTITFTGLSVIKYGNSWDSIYGLMISKIASASTVSFKKITMTGYHDDSDKVASALIGQVGSEDASKLTVTFDEMDIADVADTPNTPDKLIGNDTKEGNKVLAYASFIYMYTYQSETLGMYNFTWNDYVYGRFSSETSKGVVTLGSELGNDVTGYYDVEDTNVYIGDKGGDIPTNVTSFDTKFDSENYKPYVCKKQNIKVNDRSGDLLDGCGTYEDPYLIKTPHQLLALSYYLNSTSYTKALANWNINQIGSGETVCDGTHVEVPYKNGSTDAVNGDFPTRDQLNQAYYRIDNDLNMAGCFDFEGLGTSMCPFVGVIVGNHDNKPTITLPTKEKNDSGDTNLTTDVPYYGLIRYAKGTVLKDLNIKFSATVEDKQVTYANVTTAAGAIACVTGGDNIIDNVDVSGLIVMGDDSAIMVGGLAGDVERGGIILRNLPEHFGTNFNVQTSVTGTPITNDITSDNPGYPYVCSMFGMVKDAYVIYDGNYDINKKVIAPDSDLYKNANLCASRSYQIVNGAYLDQNIAEEKITIESDNAIQIPGEAQLMAFSMALNSGALQYIGNIASNSANISNVGYNQYSRCRIQNYDYIGNADCYVTGSNADHDRIDAIHYGDVSVKGDSTAYKPYMIDKYMNVSDSFINDSCSTLSVKANPMNISLSATSNVEYDMSDYGNSFRGLGARYVRNTNINSNKQMSGIFYGSFEGNNHQIKLNMIMDTMLNMSKTSLYCGLLNYLWNDDFNHQYKISDFTLSGQVLNVDHYATYKNNSWDVAQKQNALGNKYAGGLASRASGYFMIDNVNTAGIFVYATYDAGGLIGYIDSNSLNKAVTIQNCDVSGSLDAGIYSNVIQGGNGVGGLVGENWNVDLSITNCSIQSLALKETYGGGNVRQGGFIGTIRARTHVTGKGTNSAVPTLNHLNVTISVGKAGGVAGVTGTITVEISDVAAQDMMMKATETYAKAQPMIGGILGQSQGNTTISDVVISGTDSSKAVSISNTGTGSLSGAGGIIGRVDSNNNSNINLSNIEVNNAEIKSAISAGGVIGSDSAKKIILDGMIVNGTTITAYKTTDCSAGGIIGKMTQGALDLMDSNVLHASIVSDESKGAAGGYIGRVNAGNMVIATTKDHSNMGITDCSIIGGMYSGGGIGQNVISDSSRISGVEVSQNKILNRSSSTDTANSRYIGGLYGDMGEISDKQLYTDHITVKNNTIADLNSTGNTSVYIGGLGGRSLYNYGNTITLQDNYIGLIPYRTTDTVEVLQAMDMSTLGERTRYFDSSTNKIATDSVSSLVSSSDLPKYSNKLGVVFGQNAVKTDGNIYLVHVNTDYKPAILEYKPVVDVGNESEIPDEKNMYEYQKNYHILYQDYPETDASVSTSVFDSLKLSDIDQGNSIASTKSIWDYYSNSSNDLRNTYMVSKSRTYHWYSSDADSSDTIKYSDVYNGTFYKESEDTGIYVSQFVQNKKPLPIIVYNAKYGDISQVVDTFASILTNGGFENVDEIADEYELTTRKVALSKDEDGNYLAVEKTEETPSVTVSDHSLNYDHDDDFDEDGSGTISIVRIMVKSTSNTAVSSFINSTSSDIKESKGYQFYIDIPVFVQPMLVVENNTGFMEGTVPSYETIINSGSQNATITNGEVYTMYTEFAYNKTRKEIDAPINKTFLLDRDGDDPNAELYKGTRLTLIDINNGNKVYYYTVNETTIDPIPFTLFKDSSGAAYTGLPINSDQIMNLSESQESLYQKNHDQEENLNLDGIGIERYLMIVDCSQISTVVNKVYEPSFTPMELVDASSEIYSRTQYDPNAGLKVRVEELPGFTMSIDSLTNTGALAAGNTLSYTMNYSIKADAGYWASFLASSNNVYAEIAVSLRKKNDEDSSTQVAFPTDTRVTYSYGDEGGSESRTLNNEQMIYYFKDNNKSLEMHSLEDDASKTANISFDFSESNWSEMKDGEYFLQFDLIETSDKNYPRSGSVEDSRQDTQNVNMTKEIGFAMNTDNLDSLVFNQYLATSEMKTIPFKVRLDFKDFISDGGIDESSIITDKNYWICFEISKKVKNPLSHIFSYERMSDSGTLITAEGEDTLTQSHTFHYHMSTDAIKGSTTNGKAGLVEFQYYLKTIDALRMDPSNYKVTAVLIVKDNDIEPTEDEIHTEINKSDALSDFYVFTIGNLKNDGAY